MAKFSCKCGKLLSTSSCPNDVQLRVYTDKEYDEILELEYLSDIPLPKYDVWNCNHCGRVYVFDEQEVIRTYIIEL
ncbi:hypothetical protein FPZ44_05215 [Paenibacillus agilis]|uniref:Uncharacterized protein n=1 Tax=Paenibacillus agilis TaxID=3020863 RepID=A0A559IXY8_9BACL|nr:hypothetical protein FPZ44_05215 [Paenibacillus agilis]